MPHIRDPFVEKPSWLTVTAPPQAAIDRMYRLLEEGSLNTVCDWANCPNLGECYHRGTATFMILGAVCTRNCAFCAVPSGKPEPIDEQEPRHVAEAVKRLGLKHVVITSVTRDDLPDGGASHFAATIQQIRQSSPGTTVEVLIPDLQCHRESLRVVVQARPDIIGHNLETVARLSKIVRHRARYERSLQVLQTIKQLASEIYTKSGLMLGLGETEEELVQSLKELRAVGCDFLTLGQYMQPTDQHVAVVEYIPPEKFGYYHEIALRLGFLGVVASPLARSSYHADEMIEDIKLG